MPRFRLFFVIIELECYKFNKIKKLSGAKIKKLEFAPVHLLCYKYDWNVFSKKKLVAKSSLLCFVSGKTSESPCLNRKLKNETAW